MKCLSTPKSLYTHVFFQLFYLITNFYEPLMVMSRVDLAKKKMKRTDARVRKRCRELYGEDWFKTDKAVRQDAAIRELTVDVLQNSERTVRALVSETIPGGLRVSAITKIDNASMMKCYEALKSRLNAPDERVYLFHGTSHEASKNIVANGFNRSYCGRNATVYGRGVYFARDFSYSAQPTYSPQNAQGDKVIIAARVLTGKLVLGTSSMVEPGAGNDCSVNSLSDPSIFVVYKDFQAVPEFLIHISQN